ncbi:MAG: OsmC family protein [Bacteroidales bacterium]|nr:OsmC family protein [Bacteroidales bacterium]
MKAERISTKWIDNMGFETEVNGHKIIIDAIKSVGGLDRGPQPKPLMQASLAGCTAMDVISILGKMRVELDDFQVHVEGELTEEHPKHYKSMHIIYEFTGKNLPMDKLEKAVNLSQDRYCGVSYTYKQVMEITHEIIINEK